MEAVNTGGARPASAAAAGSSIGGVSKEYYPSSKPSSAATSSSNKITENHHLQPTTIIKAPLIIQQKQYIYIPRLKLNYCINVRRYHWHTTIVLPIMKIVVKVKEEVDGDILVKLHCM